MRTKRGLDGVSYTNGTVDYIVSQTEAIIKALLVNAQEVLTQVSLRVKCLLLFPVVQLLPAVVTQHLL